MSEKDWKRGRAIVTFDPDGKMIRAGPVNTPSIDEQPFIGWVRFKFRGVIIEKRAIAVHSLTVKNSHISFKLTNRDGTNSYKVLLEDMDFLTVSIPEDEFTERFLICDKKLRSKES